MNHTEVLSLISVERKRQDRLKAEGKFPFTCADVGLSHEQRFSILSEEVGEVARELNEANIKFHQMGYPYHICLDGVRLRKELVQIGAIISAWLERFDFPPKGE